MNVKHSDVCKGENGFEVHYEAEAIGESKTGGGKLAANKCKNTYKNYHFQLTLLANPFC